MSTLTHHRALLTAASVAALALAPGAAPTFAQDAQEPAPLPRPICSGSTVTCAARQAVVVIHTGQDVTGAAVRVGPREYVTSSSLVARTADISASFQDGPSSRATKLGLTNLPIGLSLLQLPADASAAQEALSVDTSARWPKRGDRFWLVTARTQRNKKTGKTSTQVGARRVSITDAEPGAEGGTDTRAIRRLSARVQPGFKGGAIVSDDGQLRGIAVPSPGAIRQITGRDKNNRVQSTSSDPWIYMMVLRRKPEAASAAPLTDDGGFPAVPLTIGLGVLLLASQVLLQWRGRRRAAAAGPAAPASTTAAAPATPSAAAADDIEVTLRR